MWLIMHKQSKRESYGHRKRTKATMVEGINPITTKKHKKKQKEKTKQKQKNSHTSSLTFTAGTKRLKSRVW